MTDEEFERHALSILRRALVSTALRALDRNEAVVLI